jgi:DNA-binding LytR/AlgR family response regulator
MGYFAAWFMDKQTFNKLYSPDIRIFGVAIPLISAFNYYLTYTNIQLNGFLLLTFIIDTLQGYIAWWVVRSIIFRLDTTMPYTSGLLKRLVVQVLLTLLAGMGIIISLTELVSWIARGKSAHISFYSMDIFIISIWFLVINGIYMGIYFYRQWQMAEATKKIAVPKAGSIQVKTGNTTLLVPFEEIACCFVDGEYVKMVTISSKSYFLSQSLNRLEDQLPPSLFFRLNRQCMLHRQAISGFKRLDNGKLEVQIQNPGKLPLELTISRTKAVAFKGWFLPGNRQNGG